MAHTRDTSPSPGQGSPAQRFGRLIRTARENKKWSQEYVGDQSGVGRQTIIRWESGKSQPDDAADARAVCRVLGLDPLRAAVIFGWLTEEEIGQPYSDTQATQDSPEVRDALGILRDPEVSDEIKREWIAFLRHRARAS